MPRTMSYEEKKAKYKKEVVAFLNDCYTASEGESVLVTDVKRLLHSSSADAFTMPILRDLVKEGKITLLLQGLEGGIYFTDKWKEKTNGKET